MYEGSQVAAPLIDGFLDEHSSFFLRQKVASFNYRNLGKFMN